MASSDPRWWVLDELHTEEDAWKRIHVVARALEEDLKDDKERMARCARLYDPLTDFIGAEIDMRTGPYPAPGERGPVTLNVVKSCVDTVTSMIAKNQPRAAFMTDGADWSTAQRAENLEKVVAGEFQRTDLYDHAVRMFRDCTISGIGCIKPYEGEDGTIQVARVVWDRLIVDRVECLAGEPRQLHELSFLDRGVLAEMFPDKREIIERSVATDTIRRFSSYRQVADTMVTVIESWHLPSAPGAGDGAYAVTIDGATLTFEEYTEDHFPHVFIEWCERITGFFGVGLCEELAGIQNRINKINWHISRCHDLSNTYVLVQAIDASLRIKATGGNAPLQLLPFRGTIPPKFEVPGAVPPELYEHLQYLIGMAYRLSGVSELSAQSQKPAGLESAVALQTYTDIESRRFAIIEQRFERAILEIARRMVALIKKIRMRNGDAEPKTVWKSHNAMKSINWKDVDLEEDMYTMSIEASSILARTPAGRIQAAVELGNAGLFDRDELRSLIGHPDIEDIRNLEDAALEHGQKIVEMLLKAEYYPPEVLDNLPVCLKIVSNAFMLAKDRGAPENILDGFRQWIKAGNDIMAAAAGAGAAQDAQAAQGAQPPGGGPPPPPGAGPPPSIPKPPQLNLSPQGLQ